MEKMLNSDLQSIPANCNAIYVPITQSVNDVRKGAKTLSDAIAIDWRIGKDRLQDLDAATVAVGVANGLIQGIFTLNGYHINQNGNGRIILDLGNPVFPAATGHKTTFRFCGPNVHFDTLQWLP